MTKEEGTMKTREERKFTSDVGMGKGRSQPERKLTL